MKLRTSIVIASLAALLAGCDTLGPPVTHAAYKVERWRSDLQRKEVALPDGTRIVYLEGGQGEPLVLLHGFGTDKDNFTRVARWLTPHYRVIAPDLIGFGESAHLPQADYHYAAQARRVHAFVQALALGRVHLGGNSMGGAVALSYAAQYPQQVGSLWLLDTAGIAGAPPSELVTLITRGARNPLLVTKESDFPALVKFTMTDPPYLPGFVMDVLARERIANQALEREVFQQIATDSVNDAIRGLPTPTLIVWGADDRVLSPGTVPMLQALLPHAQAIVMPHVGHAPMIERPQQSAEDYLRFRTQMPASAAQ
jgi:pimeloyl-ACP methyl ester carboxylesterase